jgi:quercetin dioxygenase-like cupin family protein
MDAWLIGAAEPAGACHFGDLAFTTVIASAFDGMLSLFEVELAAGCLSGPLHVHEREDALTYVLSGCLTFQVGDDIVIARAGTTVLEPRGVPHTFWNAGPTPARALDVATPGGLELLYEELAALADDADAALSGIASLEARYGVRMDWDSLPALLERHHLRFAIA